ncbi:hypothetical protein ACJZ2D_002514 [Fusarium nematophilum]
MAEPFGIVSGAVSLASAFSTCVDIFNYVRLSRRFGKDYQTNTLKLALGNRSANKEELQAAKDMMMQILVLFDGSNAISKKFKMETKGAEDATPELEQDFAALAIDNKMRNLALRRHKHASLLKLSSWSIHHATAFKALIEDIAHLVDGLEQLFPPPPMKQLRLAKEEAIQFEANEETRALLEASAGIDDALRQAMHETLGHQYKRVEIDAGEDGAVMDGNLYVGDYSNDVGSGAPHTYDGVRIKGIKGLRVLNGDKYGGDDFLSGK